jgi:hypothetical protein
MSQRIQSHVFWGSHSPFSTLIGGGLVILASTRLAFAIICAGALLWVYGLTALVYFSGQRLMPKKGKPVILLFLSSLICSIYILLIGFLNPLLIMGTGFFLILVPPCCIGAGLFERLKSMDLGEAVSRSLLEGVVLGGMIIAVALVREPLGLGSVSFPGGAQGLVEIFGGEGESFFPIRVFSVSAGGFFILGYGVALFRYFRGVYTNIEDE